jgi:hypothetical protein
MRAERIKYGNSGKRIEGNTGAATVLKLQLPRFRASNKAESKKKPVAGSTGTFGKGLGPS